MMIRRLSDQESLAGAEDLQRALGFLARLMPGAFILYP